MKRILLTFITALIVTGSYSQSLKVIYNRTLDVSNHLKEIEDPTIRKMVKDQLAKPVKYELLSCNGISTFQRANAETSTSEGNTSVTVQRDNTIIYKNQNTNTAITQNDYKSRLFLIKEELTKYTWKITDEKVKIGDYVCTKAILKQNVNHITAWFTTDLAVSEGPSVYYGLPGLIMKLIDGKITYEVSTISPSKEILKITEPKKGKKITRREFDKIKAQKEKNQGKPKGGVTVITKTY